MQGFLPLISFDETRGASYGAIDVVQIHIQKSKLLVFVID
jgi:hypothetical protein